MALPQSWVAWLKAEIDKALPTNTSGAITAEHERDLMYKVVEKSDPLPYTTALQDMVAEDLNQLNQTLKVKIAEVDNKADNTNQELAAHKAEFDQVKGEVVVLQKTVEDMGVAVADLQKTVNDLVNRVIGLEERVTALETPA